MDDVPRSRDPSVRSGHSNPKDRADQTFDTILFDDAWRWVYEHTAPTRDPIRMVIEPELADPGDPYYQFRLEHLVPDTRTQDDGVPTYRSASRGGRCRVLAAEIAQIGDQIVSTETYTQVGIVLVQLDLDSCNGSMPKELRALLGGQPHTGIIDFDIVDEDTIELTIDVDRGTAFYRDWWEITLEE